MPESHPPSKHHPSDAAPRRARKSAVRVNALPDTYPTAQGAGPPPPAITLEPVEIPVAEPIPVAGYPESPALVFEATPVVRAAPKPPRPGSRLPRRLFWAGVSLVAGAAIFFTGM